MAIVQKLRIDKELTNNIQVIVRDETGVYSPTNTTGYGGVANGNPPSKFERYIFDLVNLYTNVTFRHIQSDNLTNPAEHHDPSIAGIVNKDPVIIDSDNYNLMFFEDGVYKLNTTIQLSDVYVGNGLAGAETIVGVSDAKYIYDNYKSVIVGDQIYLLQGVVGTTLIINRPVLSTFSSFKLTLRTSTDFVLSDKLNECLNSALSKFAGDCGCQRDVNKINQLSELQLFQWGIARATERNDFAQAFEFFVLSKDLCASLSCGCNG